MERRCSPIALFIRVENAVAVTWKARLAQALVGDRALSSEAAACENHRKFLTSASSCRTIPSR